MSWWPVFAVLGLGGIASLVWSALRLSAVRDREFVDEAGKPRELGPCDDPRCDLAHCRPVEYDDGAGALLEELLGEPDEPLSEAIVRRDIRDVS